MDRSGVLTLILWLVSIAGGAVAFTRMRMPQERALQTALRLSFALMLALALWSVSTYLLWRLGVDLNIGIIRDGRMAKHAWLPGLTTALACVNYCALKSGTARNGA